jgi:CheY-like chemotaxis protein
MSLMGSRHCDEIAFMAVLAVPREPDRPPNKQSSGPRRRPDTGTRRKPRVLIVEDDDDTRTLYALCMRDAGWYVEEVANGADALAVAAVFAPDVIVMDLHMPEVSGIEATRRLKQDARTAHIPVLACTAYGERYLGELLDVGFDELLKKPCTPDELQVLIADIVRGRGARPA